MLQGDIPQDKVQALRSVNTGIPHNAVLLTTPDEILHADTMVDSETQKEIVMWENIIRAFNNAVQVRNKTRVVPFSRGADHRVPEPHRIAAIPDTVLDEIVENPVVDQRIPSLQVQQRESPPVRPLPLPHPLPSPPQPQPPPYESTIRVDSASSRNVRPPSNPSSTSSVSSTTSSTVRQTPMYGPGEAMMNSHPPINRSSPAVPPVRVPQIELHQQSWTVSQPSWIASHKDHQFPGNSITIEPQLRGLKRIPIIDPSTRTPILLPEKVLTPRTIYANRDDMNSQVAFGDMYRDGKGVPQDYKLAMKCYRKAANPNPGYPPAQYRVGNMYVFGLGVNKSPSKAMKWHLKAAKQGYPDSQNFIGDQHCVGRGAHNYAQAMEWHLKAANQGYTASQYRIGVLYDYGHGVAQDFVKATEWYIKAANQGNADSQYSLGYLYHHRQGVASDGVKAVEWYQKAADQGHFSAKTALEDLKSCGVVGH